MRCFIAIDIDEQIQKSLGDLQRRLQAEAGLDKSGVKWVKPELMHLTLKFLGEVDDSRIPQVCDIAGQVAKKYSGFEIDVAKVGYFGKSAARVLWVGLTDAAGTLLSLQEDLENQLAEAGWPKEQRRFSAHLTLCRIKNTKAGKRLAEISKGYADFAVGSAVADAVCVYQSQLRPAGPIYARLAQYELKQEG